MSSTPISLTDLLVEIGNENLTFQMLNKCLDGNQNVTKGGTRLSFVTAETLSDVVMTGKRQGLVLWIDKDRIDAAMAALKKKGKARG